MAQPSNNIDAEKFLAAYDEHADAIFRFAVLKVSDREKALDIVQDTFARVWEYTMSGNKIESWKPFLFRTANNLIIDHYRKKKSDSLDALEEESGFIAPDTSHISSETQAELTLVHSYIKRLEDMYRDPLTLRFVEGLPPRDIANILDLTENVVSVRIHRGLEKVRAMMEID